MLKYEKEIWLRPRQQQNNEPTSKAANKRLQDTTHYMQVRRVTASYR
jgi:hypothetical protein